MQAPNSLRTRLWLAVFALAPVGAGAGACQRPALPPYEVDPVTTCMGAASARTHAPAPATNAPDILCPSEVDLVPAGEPSAATRRSHFVADTTAQQRADKGQDVCCYQQPRPVPGRAYVDDGAGLVSAAPRARGASDIAQRWLDDAALEHASVASFARVTLELMAVGAPLWLLRETQEAALDEVRHAELCLDVARALGADVDERRPFGPLTALAPRPLDLAGVARACLEEACIPETLSAANARAEAEHAEGLVAEVLRTIADDEERHAALAWRTLRWALAEGGAPVAYAVRDAVERGLIEGEHPVLREVVAPMVAALLDEQSSAMA